LMLAIHSPALQPVALFLAHQLSTVPAPAPADTGDTVHAATDEASSGSGSDED